ncbi:MAG: YvcK family protein, partial [Negativicutes bacterium]|nr:YvcK family protein [Negativicutes bacterium]
MLNGNHKRFSRWLQPGIGIKRWFLLFAVGVILAALGLAFSWNYRFIGSLEESTFRFFYWLTGSHVYMATTIAGIATVALGITAMLVASRKMIQAVAIALGPDGAKGIMDTIYEKRKLDMGPHVVAIGGGTGLSVLLRGIKDYTSNIAAIVTVGDDGGSSGRLREDFGIVPPGDIRNCLVALADTEPVMESLFQYRFKGSGDLSGHSFGNLFLTAMLEVTDGDIEKALRQSNKVLRVRGRVIPSSHTPVRLIARMANGQRKEGESHIGEAGNRIDEISIEPVDAKAPAEALQAIAKADVILLGPGSLYTSVIPNLLVPGIADAIRANPAPKVYICNVMTQPGETDDYSALDHLKAIEKHGGKGLIDLMV